MQVSFVTLPQDLLRGCLLPLLSAKCLAALDNALCNQLSRSHILETMVGHRVHLPHVGTTSTEALALRWLHKRRMFTRQFIIATNKKTLQNFKKCELASIFRHLESLRIYKKGRTAERLFLLLSSQTTDILEVLIAGRDCSISEHAIAKFLERQSNIKRISVLHSQQATDNIFSIIADHCALLEEVTLSYCRNVTMDSASISQMFQKCRSLRTIRFVGQFSQNPHPDTLVNLGQFCLNLQELDLSAGGRGVSDESIMPILEGCPLLSILNLGNTSITVTGFVMIARMCSHLAHLMINMPDDDSRILEGFRLLEGSLLTFTGELHPRIVNLSAPYWGETMRVLEFRSRNVSDAQILCIVRSCPHLTHLKVLGGEDISDGALDALSIHARNMKVIVIIGGSHITDVGICALASGCSQLRFVRLTECTSLTGVGLLALVRECPLLLNVLVRSCTVDHIVLHLSLQNTDFLRFGIAGFSHW